MKNSWVKKNALNLYLGASNKIDGCPYNESGSRSEPDKLSVMKSNQFSIQSRIRSFRFAGEGIFSFILKEHNAMLHFMATVVVITLGVLTGLSSGEWMAILLSIGLVWVAEMFNTCIEKLIDFIAPGYHQQIKFIKDVAAGAVLVAALVALAIGLIVFIPHLLY
jgi:diacylglycerol kinase (ATP)